MEQSIYSSWWVLVCPIISEQFLMIHCKDIGAHKEAA